MMGEGKCCEGTGIAHSDPTVEVSSSSVAAATSQVHVLAVDDCLIDRKVIERLLKTSFFKVTAVESAARALEVLGVDDGEPLPSHSCNEPKVNMILTDYCMPGMNGYDLLKKVKETQGLKEIPVVMMSSEDVPQRIKRCLAEGAEDFIIKPVQIGDIKKLRSHIKPPKSLSRGSIKRKSYTASRQGTTKKKTNRHRRNPKSFRKRKVSTGIIAEKSSDERCHLNGVVVA